MSVNRPKLDLTIKQASTFFGARQALFWVTTLPSTLNTRSLLLLATGWDGWDLCPSHLFYKQVSPPKFIKMTKFIIWVGNPERSHTFGVKSWDQISRLILSCKIPGSWDFAKSRPVNPGIENSWSRWSLSVRGTMGEFRGWGVRPCMQSRG